MRDPGHWEGVMGSKSVRFVAVVAIAAAVLAAWSSAGSSGSSSAGTTTQTTAAYTPTTNLGPGVTATTIKVGVSLVDFNCIKQFVDSIRVDQAKNYQAFI